MKFKNYNCRSYSNRERLKWQLIKDIINEGVTVINLFDTFEYAPAWNSAYRLRQVCQEYNVHINYLYGAIDQSYYDQVEHFGGLVNVWPEATFKLTYLEQQAVNSPLLSAQPTEFKYNIMCLNACIHIHRYHMIKELKNRNLLEGNAISWLGDRKWIEAPYHNYKGEWEKLNQVDIPIMQLTELGEFNELCVPVEWNQSFLHVVNESTVGLRCLTEKTVKCLLGCNLFIIWGGTGVHDWLRQKGFELYDEIIDYTFDKEPSSSIRLPMIVDQIERVLSYPDQLEIYNKLKLKLEHNRKRAIEIALEDSTPSMITEFDFHDYDYLITGDINEYIFRHG